MGIKCFVILIMVQEVPADLSLPLSKPPSRSTAVCQPGCKHGDCVGPNKCKCHPGFTGKTCNQGERLSGTQLSFWLCLFSLCYRSLRHKQRLLVIGLKDVLWLRVPLNRLYLIYCSLLFGENGLDPAIYCLLQRILIIFSPGQGLWPIAAHFWEKEWLVMWCSGNMKHEWILSIHVLVFCVV